MNTPWRAWRFFRPDWPLLGAAFGLLILSVGTNLLKPWPLALLVDCVFGAQPLPSRLGDWNLETDRALLIGLLAGLVLALHASHGLLSAAQNYLAIRLGLRGLRRVREAVFVRLQRLSLAFHQGQRSGDTIYRATWDTYAFQTLFQQGFMTFCTALVWLALMVAVMVQVNGRLTLVALGVAPLLMLVIRGFGREMRDRGDRAQQADAQVAALVQQAIVALPLTQAYTREAVEEVRFAEQSATAQDRRLAQHRWELAYWLAVSLVFAAGTGAIVWVGSRQVLGGELTIGQLLIFLAYLAQLYDPLNQLSHVGATVSQAGAGARRVFEILDTPEAVADRPDARPVVRHAGERAETPAAPASPALVLRGELAFDRVSFGYDARQPVLHALSFRLAPGQSAALIGPSGAGKSSLLHLLPRFYDPTAGAIRLDGTDLRDLRLHDLRAHVGFVMQDALLLPGSVAENIACGRADATPARIEAAARDAQADAFIRALPHGYDTVIGEGAARLSAGERQRLNLARAILKDAPILVLDEPTSALDGEGEAALMHALSAFRRGRTVLLATHRLRTVRDLDVVLVLERGRLVEQGPPARLLAEPSSYLTRLLAAG